MTQIAIDASLKSNVDRAFLLMNAYASGETQKQFSRVEPTAVLSEVYMLLAPVSQALQAATEAGPPQVVVEHEGGVIHGVYTTGAVQVLFADDDIEGVWSEADQHPLTNEPVYYREEEAKLDPERARAHFQAAGLDEEGRDEEG